MKKLNKLLVPTLAVSALAVVPTIGMTSCSKQDKTLVGYTVDQNTYRIYGLNKAGESFELEDKQIEDLAGGFLITMGDGTYLHVDKTGKGSDGKTTWPTTIKGWMERANEASAFYYEIWLLGGDYDLESIDEAKKSHIKFDIKGIINNKGELTSSVNVLPDDTTPGTDPVTGTINLGDFRDLNFSTVNIKGAMKEIQGNDFSVKGADTMSFTYCHFYGLAIFDVEYLDLYGCTLDSDCIEWKKADGSSRKYDTTQYALWLKNVDFASFSYCNFISDGKALKIQPKGEYSPRYVFNTCDFSIGPKGIPQGDKNIKEAGHNEQDKYAVECNNKEITYMTIYWYKITGDILKEDVLTRNDENRDWKHHTGRIGSYDDGEWFPAKAEVIEGELPA